MYKSELSDPLATVLNQPLPFQNEVASKPEPAPSLFATEPVWTWMVFGGIGPKVETSLSVFRDVKLRQRDTEPNGAGAVPEAALL
jgi:hypothetical protein